MGGRNQTFQFQSRRNRMGFTMQEAKLFVDFGIDFIVNESITTFQVFCTLLLLSFLVNKWCRLQRSLSRSLRRNLIPPRGTHPRNLLLQSLSSSRRTMRCLLLRRLYEILYDMQMSNFRHERNYSVSLVFFGCLRFHYLNHDQAFK